MSRHRDELEMIGLGNALDRLREALANPDNPLVVDATIQRFEFTIELFWKTLKHFLANEKIQVVFPKQAFQKAYALGWLREEDTWLNMLDDRNRTSHVYNEAQAKEIYDRIRGYYPELSRVYLFLRSRLGGAA